MQRFAVLGHPINHSFSPVMHTASFRSIGFDGEYVRLDVPPEMLGDALKALADEGFSGVNLTIPHKMLALPMMDALTPEAQRLGAVNTVRFAQGRMEGHNTDGPGFLAAAQATLGVDPAGQACAVIGCGGAGRALGYVCAPSILQKVVGQCVDCRPDLEAYEENRKLLYDSLTEYGYQCVYPDGAFYLCAKALEPDAKEFCRKAMAYDLALVPGDTFGCPGYFRMAFCVDEEVIRGAAPGIAAAVRRVRRG